MRKGYLIRPLLLMFVITFVFCVPKLSSLLVYSRKDILDGEIWRLITGNLSHFTWQHLLFNLMALGVIGWIIEERGYPHFWLVVGLSGLSVGTGLLLGMSQVSQYGGMSGVVIGLMVYASLCGIRENGLWHLISAALFLLIIIKIAIEFKTGVSLLSSVSEIPFVPIPLVHLIGAITGFLVALCDHNQVPSDLPSKNQHVCQ